MSPRLIGKQVLYIQNYSYKKRVETSRRSPLFNVYIPDLYVTVKLFAGPFVFCSSAKEICVYL